MPSSRVPALPAPLLPVDKQSVAWADMPVSLQALSLVEAARHAPGPVLAVARGEHAAYALEAACRYFADGDVPVTHFPDLEVLPYDTLSPLAEIISDRLSALARLPTLQRGLVIAGADALLQRLPPAGFVAAHTLDIRVGQRIDSRSCTR